MRKRWIVLMVLVACLAWMIPSGAVGESVIYDWMIFENLTEPLYTKVSGEYTLPIFKGEAVVEPAGITIATGDSDAVMISAPEDGL